MTTYIASTSGGEIDGSAGNDVMIGKSGDDTFDGGTGSDILFGGAGNDIIYYDEIDIRVDGGTGYDTLVFNGTGQSLNLGLQKTVMNFEKIELSGGGGHSLTFSAADVLRTSDLDSLLIRGTSSSTVNFADGGWIFQSYSGGQSTFINGSASVIIDNAVNVAGFSNNAALSLGSGSETELTEDRNPDSDNMLVATGTILVSDQNAGQAQLLPGVTPIGTHHGTFTLGIDPTSGLPNGDYTYMVSNEEAQKLGANKSWTDTFAVTSVDGSTTTLDFNVNGVDDPANIGLPTNASVKEDTNITPGGKLEAVGTIAISDVDELENRFDVTKINGTGTWGTLLLDADGNYTYSVNNASVNGLAENETETDVFTLYSVDGTSANISFTVQGTNDAPQQLFSILIGATIYEIADNAPNENSRTDLILGSFTIRDVDNSDNLFGWVDTPTGQLGSLTVTSFSAPNSNGDRTVNWEYVITDADMDHLGSKIYQENYTIHLSDRIQGTPHATIIDISAKFGLQGSNDVPVLVSDSAEKTSGSVTELASIDPNANSSSYMHEVSGSFKVQDVDLGDTLSLSGIIHTSTGMTQYGGLIIDSISSRDNSGIRTVNWSYSVSDQDLNPLAAGSGPTENFAISLTDGTATLVQNVSVALTGTADGPTFSGDLLKTVTEFADTSAVENTGFHTITGTIQISNLPAGGITAKMVNFPGSNSFGMFSSTVSGITLEGKATVEWTYTVADCLLDFLGGSATYRDGTTLEISYSANPFDIKSVNIDLMGAMDSLSDKKVASYGSIGDDIKTIAQVGPYQVYGSGGNDLLITGSDLRTQTLFGDTGDDRFQLSIGKSLSIGDVGQDYFDFFPALDKIIQAFAWGGQDEDTFDIVKMESSSIAWAMDFRLGEDRIDVMSTAQMYEMTLKYTTASDTTSRGYNPFVPDGTSYYALSGPGASDSTITFNIIGSPLQASDLTSILI